MQRPPLAESTRDDRFAQPRGLEERISTKDQIRFLEHLGVYRFEDLVRIRTLRLERFCRRRAALEQPLHRQTDPSVHQIGFLDDGVGWSWLQSLVTPLDLSQWEEYIDEGYHQICAGRKLKAMSMGDVYCADCASSASASCHSAR